MLFFYILYFILFWYVYVLLYNDEQLKRMAMHWMIRHLWKLILHPVLVDTVDKRSFKLPPLCVFSKLRFGIFKETWRWVSLAAILIRWENLTRHIFTCHIKTYWLYSTIDAHNDTQTPLEYSYFAKTNYLNNIRAYSVHILNVVVVNSHGKVLIDVFLLCDKRHH